MIRFECKGPQINKQVPAVQPQLLPGHGSGRLPLHPVSPPGPPQACSELTPVENFIRQESLTADTHRDGTSYAKSVFSGESCPCLLQKPAGAWEDSAPWPDVKVLHTHLLSQFIPSRQSQIIKPNEVLGLLGTPRNIQSRGDRDYEIKVHQKVRLSWIFV